MNRELFFKINGDSDIKRSWYREIEERERMSKVVAAFFEKNNISANSYYCAMSGMVGKPYDNPNLHLVLAIEFADDCELEFKKQLYKNMYRMTHAGKQGKMTHTGKQGKVFKQTSPIVKELKQIFIENKIVSPHDYAWSDLNAHFRGISESSMFEFRDTLYCRIEGDNLFTVRDDGLVFIKGSEYYLALEYKESTEKTNAPFDDEDGKWLVSDDEQYWNELKYFDTPEEAIEYGIALYRDRAIIFFYIGQLSVVSPIIPAIAEDIINDIIDTHCSDHGEHAEGYLSDFTLEHTLQLDEVLADVITRFLVEKDYFPNYFMINNVREVEIPQREDQ